MQMKLIEEIKLANGLILMIFDLSRAIAADTVKVEVFFRTKVALKKAYFTDARDYDKVKNIMGDELSYEHRLERSFVPKNDEDLTRTDLISTFKNNSLNYLSSEKFPQNMALSRLREIKNNPFKYQFHSNSVPEE